MLHSMELCYFLVCMLWEKRVFIGGSFGSQMLLKNSPF